MSFLFFRQELSWSIDGLFNEVLIAAIDYYGIRSVNFRYKVDLSQV